MLNDIPFQRTELFLTDENKNAIITGSDGTVIYRFPTQILKGLESEQ